MFNKQKTSRGFTLIELLIVVIIVAILAAIAIPQFSSSTTDAQAAALDANLASIRTALERYKVQHGGNYPGAVSSTLPTGNGATLTCPTNGKNQSAAAGSLAAVTAQLQYYSNSAGAVCDIGDATNFKYGPYLRQGLPAEPMTNSVNVALTTSGAPIAPAAATGGWAYDTVSGQFVMNSNALDSGSPQRAYSAH